MEKVTDEDQAVDVIGFVILSCDVCNNHWDAVVHMETFDSDTQVSTLALVTMVTMVFSVTRFFLRQVALVTLDPPTLITMGLLVQRG